MECKIISKKNQNQNQNQNQHQNIPLYRNLFEPNSDIYELTLKDFIIRKNQIHIRNKIFQEGYTFILFYAPWCHHCKEFKKDYENIASNFLQSFKFGAINVENVRDGNDKLRMYAKITSIPQLRYINRNGDLEKFPYILNYDDIIYYISLKLSH
jgi:thiol-disulfide isomerase/thioredoxin